MHIEEVTFDNGLPVADPRTDPAAAVLRGLVIQGTVTVEAEPHPTDHGLYTIEFIGTSSDLDGVALGIRARLEDPTDIARWLNISESLIGIYPAGTRDALETFLANELPIITPKPQPNRPDETHRTEAPEDRT